MKGKALPPIRGPVAWPDVDKESQREFLARGLLARDAAKADRVYVSVDAMLARLDEILTRAQQKASRPPPLQD